MTEPRDVKIKRLHMRSIRRGIKEMDLILSRFWTEAGGDLSDAELDLYEALLGENDQDLYQWVSGQAAAPDHFAELVLRLRK